jgi:hypothetical protein
MTRADTTAALDASRVLWDALIWRVRLNIQHRFERTLSDDLYSPEDLDEICLDFQKPLAVPEGVRKDRRVGSLWVNVANCGLRLTNERKVLVRSGDSTSTILKQFPQMIDLRLMEAQIDCPGGDTRFVFDRGRTLTCFPANTTGGVSWVVVTEEGDEFRFGPGIASQP